jgi:SulP family sulfate permease
MSAQPDHPPLTVTASREGSIFGDLAGGFSASLVALPQALAMGALVFMPLGPDKLHLGIAAGFTCAIAGGLVAGFAGGARYQISGPRASTSVILAAMVASLAATGLSAAHIATLACVTVFLGGLLQVLFAWLRLGQALKFIPHPVLAGFMYGVALLIFIQQARPILGVAADVPFYTLIHSPNLIKPLAVIVALVTITAALTTPRISSRIPSPLAGLIAGTLTFLVLRSLFGGDSLGSVLGVVPNGLFNWSVPDLLAMDWGALPQSAMPSVLTTAALLAIVGSIDSLLCVATIDAATGSHQSGDKALHAQGFSNFLAALGGGIFASGTTLTVLTNFRAGGRTQLSGIAHSVFLMIMVLIGGPVVAQIPLGVLAGIMVTIAVGVLDDWSRDLFQRIRGDATFKKEMAANLAIVVLVCATTVMVNIVAAVVIGVIAATMLLLVNMSTSIVYRVFDGTARSSLKMRPAADVQKLHELGKRVGVAELSGYVFFGTADRMRNEVESLAQGRLVLILDFRRVHEVEASGARVLGMMGRSLASQGIGVALSHVRRDEPLGRYLQDMGVAEAIPQDRWFTDLDRALEWAEDRVLASPHGGDLPPGEIAVEETTLFQGLTDEEAAYLRARMSRREYAQGSVIFSEGEPGDHLYAVTRGEVSIKIKLPGTERSQRLAAFGPGLVFGEMALLEGHSRSADAYAKQDTVLWSLKLDELERVRGERPDIALKITTGFTRQLAMRLRLTSDQLRKSY